MTDGRTDICDCRVAFAAEKASLLMPKYHVSFFANNLFYLIADSKQSRSQIMDDPQSDSDSVSL